MTRSARSSVIACDKREAFAQGSAATKQSSFSLRSEMDCFAALAMTERHGLLRRGACHGRATRWLAMTGRARSSVIACDKREAFAQGSAATKQSSLSLRSEMDCFAALAMTERVWLATHGGPRPTRDLAPCRRTTLLRHCEERSDEAIHLSFRGGMDCFAAVAMTERHGLLRGARRRA